MKRDELVATKQRTIDLFVAGKLSDEQKDAHYETVSDQLKAIQKDLRDISTDELDKDVVIDEAIRFMRNVKEYWIAALVELKVQLQDLIFPEGVEYNFQTGFGTAVLSPAYLLIRKMTDETAINQNLVGVTGLEPVTKRL